jgi:[acyl-carrier-protein] S-malonyltransferase
MAEASAAEPTGMSAVIGGEPQELEAALGHHGLFAANFNGGGQTVVAGSKDALARFAEEPPAGTRVIPLSVAGAFHTPYMSSAVASLAAAAANTIPGEPHYPLYTNRDGSVVSSGETYLSYLVDQVARPVRWDSCMESFASSGITGMMELAPAGALAGLAKRGLKGVPTVAINSPDDIAGALEMVTGS